MLTPLNQPLLSNNEQAEALATLLYRVETSLASLDGQFPYWADSQTGRWETTPDGNWCAGHWIGLLWLASRHSSTPEQREYFQAAAYRHTAILEQAKPNFARSLFAGLNFYYAGFLAHDFNPDPALLELGFWGADTVLSLYNQNASQIVSGHFRIVGPKPRINVEIEYDLTSWTSAGFGASAVDSLHVAVPVLWRAFRESGNQRYREVAMAHAEVYLGRFLREDGSTRQRVQFDPESGAVLKIHSDLAYSPETCWARGLGWCIAGLAAAWNETSNERFLAALERSVGFYLANSPADLITYWDLLDPAIPAAPRDTSAAAVIAYGLIGLRGEHAALTTLKTTGKQILAALVKSYLVTDQSDSRRGMVLHGCYNKSANYATDNELIWTNFYVAAALHQLLED